MKFNEYIIKRKKGAKEIILSVLLYFAATVISLILLLLFIKMAQITTLLAFGCFYLAYRLSTKMNKEFEYIITQDNIAIDVIMNAARRKRLISFSIPETEIIAPIDDAAYSSYLKGQFDKVIDATSRSKNASVYFAVVDGEKKALVKFEPTYAILSELYKYAPSKIKISK